MRTWHSTPAPVREAVVSLSTSEYLCLTAYKERRTAQRRRSSGSGQRQTGGANILLLGRIRELALYRAEFLRGHGYRVLTPETREEALRAIRSGNFDIAVLTYTLPSKHVEEFAQLIREYCATCPIIAISESSRLDKEINPDAIVIADDGPSGLIAAIHRVTQAQ